MRNMVARALPLLIAIALATSSLLAAYWSGLHGPFLHDDEANILGNDLVQVQSLSPRALLRAAGSGLTGGLGRPVSMLTFALNYGASGGSPFAFKLTNLLIHALNAVLVAGLLFQLLRGSPVFRVKEPRHAGLLALGGALIWALLPMQVSTVLYVVQRMTLLAGTFSLLALLSYVRGRLRQEEGLAGAHWIALCFVVWMPLSVLSKENGIMTLAYLWCVEWFALRQPDGDALPSRAAMFRYALTVCGAVCAAYLLYMWLQHNSDSLLTRGFTLTERVLTEGRILWWYFAQTLWPRIDDMALVHDTWALSRSLWQPPVTSVAWAAWVLAAGASFALRSRWPAFGIGVLWYLLGHALEAGPMGLELVYEHRNYVPSLGVVMLVVLSVRSGASLQAPPVKFALGAAFVCTIGLLARQTYQRADDWSSVWRWTSTHVKNHPDSYFAAVSGASLYAQLAHDSTEPQKATELRVKSGQMYTTALKLRPTEVQPLLGYIRLRIESRQYDNDALYDQVARMVAQPPMTINTFNSLFGFLECAARGTCPLPEGKLQKIVEAALSNPGCRPNFRANLLMQAGQYYGEVLKDPPQAVRSLRRAVSAAPGSAQSWLILAHWLDVSGDRDGALQALHELETQDRIGRYAQVAQLLHQKLDATQP